MSREPIKATLPNCDDISNAENRAHSKETTRRDVLVAYSAPIRKARAAKCKAEGWRVDAGEGMQNVVDARWYTARRSDGASNVYCSVWIHTRDGRYFSGKGTASGGGYHKESAAYGAALESAGIKLTQRVDGVGDSAIRESMMAIADAAGFRRCPMQVV